MSFLTNYGIMIPVEYHAFELVEMLNSNYRTPMYNLGLLKGVLLGCDRMIYEISAGKIEGGEDAFIVTPFTYEKGFSYGRSNNQRIDMLLSVGIHEKCDPADMIIAAGKLAELQPAHYMERNVSAIFTSLNKPEAEIQPFSVFMDRSAPKKAEKR